MPRNPRTPPVWFDTEQGMLLAGSQQELGPLVDNPNVHRLGALLCAEEFPYKSGDFEQIIPTDDWGPEECKIYGGWMLQVLAPQTAHLAPEHRLTQRHIKRARILGIGPSHARIESKFDTLSNYQEVLGIHGRSRGKYDEWSRQDFIRYAAKIAASTGRRPKREDYRDAHHRWGGPSRGVIEQHFKTIAQLNAMIGYPDVKDWDLDDFVLWGADVMRANDETKPIADLLKELARRQAGPSYRMVSERFQRHGGFKLFKRLVVQKRQEQREEYAMRYEAQLRWAKENLDEESFAIVEDLPRAEQLAFIGRYQTAKKCLRDRDTETYRNLAKAPSGSFLRQLRMKQPGLTAGEVEVTADMLGTFDDIWPPDRHLARLRVTPNVTPQTTHTSEKESELKAA